MSATPDTAAPTGRNKPAQGKERSDAALGNASQNTSSPEGAKEGSELRDGWRTVPFGDVVDILDSRRIPVNSEERAKRVGDVPYFGATGQVGVIDKHIFDEELVLLGEDGAPFLDSAKPKAYLIRGKSWVNNHAHVLRGKPGLLNGFLLYQLNNLDYRPYISGTTRLKLPQGPMKQIPLLVPPLPEQRRIVAEIEKQFTRLEAGVAALRRVQANLKRYRAAVLKAACEGRLVPTQAELAKAEGRKQKDETKRVKAADSTSSFCIPPSSFESGAALLAHILTERRQNWQGRGQYKEPAAPDTAKLSPLPEGWAWANGEQLFSWSSGEGLTQKDIQEGKFPVYGGNGVTGYHNAFVAEIPTLVIGRVGALCGNVYLTDGPSWITDNAIYAIQTPSCVAMRFIRLAFTRAELNKRAAGSGQPFVNQRMLNETIIALPPLAEQTRIVAEVERRLSVVEELETVVTANLQRATRLRQSILQKAFTGELL
jgi:type I restriction enzyme S subunit